MKPSSAAKKTPAHRKDRRESMKNEEQRDKGLIKEIKVKQRISISVKDKGHSQIQMIKRLK